LSEHTSRMPTAQASPTATHVKRSVVRSLLIGSLVLILCLIVLVTVSLLLVAHWSAVLSQLSQLWAVLALIPRPWGCGSGSGPC
jgi:uncharacterized membrane protein